MLIGDRKLMSTVAVVGLTAVGSVGWKWTGDPQEPRELTISVPAALSARVVSEPSPQRRRVPIGNPVTQVAIHTGIQDDVEPQDRRSLTLWDYAPQFILFLLTLGTLGTAALWILHLRDQQQQQRRVNHYSSQILHLIEQVGYTTSTAQLEVLHQQLFRLAKGAIEDWQREQLSIQTLPALNFTWDVAIQALYHQQQAIAQFPKQLGIAEPELMDERSLLSMLVQS